MTSRQRSVGAVSLWVPAMTLDLVAARQTAWRSLARRGGFSGPGRRFDGPMCRATYLERDLQGLSAIGALPDFRRLVAPRCLQLGQVVNQTRLETYSLPQANRYLNLLETSYLLVRLPAYAPNRGKRVSKLPKLYWSDGLALYLAQQEELGGAHLENIVALHDLLCWRDARLSPADLMYWRTASGVEVDFVIETAGRLLPIEVKMTASPARHGQPACLPDGIRGRGSLGAAAAEKHSNG